MNHEAPHHTLLKPETVRKIIDYFENDDFFRLPKLEQFPEETEIGFLALSKEMRDLLIQHGFNPKKRGVVNLALRSVLVYPEEGRAMTIRDVRTMSDRDLRKHGYGVDSGKIRILRALFGGSPAEDPGIIIGS